MNTLVGRGNILSLHAGREGRANVADIVGGAVLRHAESRASDIVVRWSPSVRAWLSTDGELVRERMPLTYEIRPRALKMLVPPSLVKK
jgi:diacylglycerol kinase family enzyme